MARTRPQANPSREPPFPSSASIGAVAGSPPPSLSPSVPPARLSPPDARRRSIIGSLTILTLFDSAGMGSTDMTLLPVAGGGGMERGQDEGGGVVASGAKTPRKKKTMKSLYLTFFETAPDGKYCTCKLCGKSYCLSTATGTTGLMDYC